MALAGRAGGLPVHTRLGGAAADRPGGRPGGGLLSSFGIGQVPPSSAGTSRRHSNCLRCGASAAGATEWWCCSPAACSPCWPAGLIERNRAAETPGTQRPASAAAAADRLASAVGTGIPQGIPTAIDAYADTAGATRGEQVLQLQLDRVFQRWFRPALAGLALSLPWRRHGRPDGRPALIDYRTPRRLSNWPSPKAGPAGSASAAGCGTLLRSGWQATPAATPRPSAALAGAAAGAHRLVLLMLGVPRVPWRAIAWSASWPLAQLDLLDRDGTTQLTITLDRFAIDRDPAGHTEQFRSAHSCRTPTRPGCRDQRQSPAAHRDHDLPGGLVASDGQPAGRSPVLNYRCRPIPSWGINSGAWCRPAQMARNRCF